MSSKIGAYDPLTTATTIGIAATSSLTSFYATYDSDLSDGSSNNHSPTAVNSAAIQTSVKKFGAGSLLLNGTNQYVSYPNDAAFQFGSGDFTIEGFIQQTTAAGSAAADRHPVVSRMSSSSNRSFSVDIRDLDSKQKLVFGFTVDGSNATEFQYDCNVTTGSLHHIAIVREGSTVHGFLNGVKATSTAAGALTSIGTETIFAGTSDLSVGHRGLSSQHFAGYIDDLRISKTAVYTTNFSVPTAAVGTSIVAPGDPDTRTHSHVWNYKDVYDPQIADNWVALAPTITIKAWGAGGGGTKQDGGNRLGAGGGGGFASVGTNDLSAGTTLRIIVGSGGPDEGSDQQPITAGPFGGGGNGYHEEQAGAAGGGFSGVFVATATQVNAIVIAGGGGGGYYEVGGGGGGGGETGRDGVGGRPGLGGTQTSGGGIHPIVTGSSATVGSALQGGSGGNSGGNRAGAGGGGGYFGGGGGQAAAAGTNLNGGAAGGGSGFVGGSTANSITVTETVNTQGSDGVGSGTINASGGSVANSGDVDYPGSPTGNGGAGASDATGGDGCVVIIERGTKTVFSSAGSYTFTVSS